MSVDATTRDRIDELERAEDRIAEVEAEIDEVGRDDVDAVADAYDEAVTLLDRYQGKASGTGREEFQAFVRFQEQFTNMVEGLDEAVPHRDAFERALETVDKRRLSESDFERARDHLSPVADVAELLENLSAAREEYREARKEVQMRRQAVEEEIEDLERLQRLGEADLDAPTERLRDPIGRYDDAVREAFETFRTEASAREVLDLVATTRDFPLIGFAQPPAELRQYVAESEAGSETIPQLLEYADYSRSKLSHYVDDPGELKRRIATRQTYLERLSAEPLTVGWAPPSAERLQFFAREAIQVCSRFADDEVVELAREVRNLPHETDYERLRDAAVAEEKLGESERQRVASGGIERDLERLREERSRIDEALDRHPRR